MTERADLLNHDNEPAHSTALVQAFFFVWRWITSPRSVSPPTAHIWLPATFGFSQSYTRRRNGENLWKRRSHSTQGQSTASHCRL